MLIKATSPLQAADAQGAVGEEGAAADSEKQQVSHGRNAPEAAAAQPVEAAPAKGAPANSPAGPMAGKRGTRQPTPAAAHQRPAAGTLLQPAAARAAAEVPQNRPAALSVPSSGRSSGGVPRQALTGSNAAGCRQQAFVFSSTDLENCLQASTMGADSNRQVDNSEQQPSQPSAPRTEVRY